MKQQHPYLCAILLGLGLLLSTAGPVQAQRGRVGGGYVHPYVHGYVGGGYHPWAHSYAWYARHYPNIYGGYWGWPYYYPYYYGYSYPYYSYAYSPYAPSYNYYVNYPTAYSSPSSWSQTPVPANRAYIQVIVPQPGTEIWFAGQDTITRGTTRMFQSPLLEPGREYHYDVRAAWTEGGQRVVQERRVDVSAGKVATVDFTQPAPAVGSGTP
jgi:uncharacterized protein (TIGR03000 family)